jgi:hypothetical protein
MKNFVLDSTYKDATFINNNDDIFITSSNNLCYNPTVNNAVTLNNADCSYLSSHNQNDKFNIYNIIDSL